jgi:hypothetical protein
MAKVFPVRVSGTSLSYNISVPIFGGFAPFFAQSLIDLTGSKIAPGYYMTADRAPKLGRACRLAAPIPALGTEDRAAHW